MAARKRTKCPKGGLNAAEESPPTETIREFAARQGFSVSAFARRHGVDRKTVRRWIANGYIAFAPDGGIDAKRSDARLAQRSAVYRGGRAKGPCAPDAPRPVDLTRMAEIDTDRLFADIAELSARLHRSVGH